MVHVLVVITIFTTAQGIATQTRFHEFGSRAACVTARDGVRDGIADIKGQMGREVYAECFEKGS